MLEISVSFTWLGYLVQIIAISAFLENHNYVVGGLLYAVEEMEVKFCEYLNTLSIMDSRATKIRTI